MWTWTSTVKTVRAVTIITEISDGKIHKKDLWSSSTLQGLFPSVRRGPFLWCLCWFLNFPYRTSLDSGNTGHSWQVASQAGNGDSLVSGMQNFPEQRPVGLERVYLWWRTLAPLPFTAQEHACEAWPRRQEPIPLPAGKDSKWEQEALWSPCPETSSGFFGFRTKVSSAPEMVSSCDRSKVSDLEHSISPPLLITLSGKKLLFASKLSRPWH